jgi:hypothetical protein
VEVVEVKAEVEQRHPDDGRASQRIEPVGTHDTAALFIVPASQT